MLKQDLLQLMESLSLPAPAAFNYHYDNGTFRGLAFANFVNHSDAALTVSAMNGYEISGRVVRVEFKKVQKEGDKQRTEKNKAIERIRETRDATGEDVEESSPPIGNWNRREASAPSAVGYERENRPQQAPVCE
jgi:RNA recognition motif-containing protein